MSKKNKIHTLINICLTVVLCVALIITGVVLHNAKKKAATDATATESVTASSQDADNQTSVDAGSDEDAKSGNNAVENSGSSSSADAGNTDANHSPKDAAQKSDTASSDSQKDSTEEDKNAADNTSIPSGNTPDFYGQLHVKDGKLTDTAGNPVQLRGLSTHGLAWFPEYVNAACIKELHENFGCNVFRMAMYTAEYGGYCTGGDQTKLKDLIDQGVSYAVDNDMYVIIDWHILSDSSPLTNMEPAKVFFMEMAEKYKDCPNVIYEICNEPNGSTTWSDIRRYAMDVINVLRARDTDCVILVGTPNWCQKVDDVLADPIREYDDIMYTLHFYADTHKQSLRDTLVKVQKENLPVFVSEFGICDASGNGAVNEKEADTWISLLNDYQISYVMWSLCNKNESASFLKDSCKKKSGFTDDDLAPSGKWFTKMMKAVPASGKNTAVKSETATTASSDKNQSQKDDTESSASDKQTSDSSESTGTLTATAKKTGSWESEGKTYEQYDIVIKNTTGKSLSSWSVDVDLQKEFKISDSWCGKFSAKKTILHIENESYNGDIEKGKTVENVGLIIVVK